MNDTFTTIALAAIVLGIILEFVGALYGQSFVRKAFYMLAMTCTIFGASILVLYIPGLFAAITLFISMFRIFNATRLSSDSVHIRRIYNVTRRSSMFFITYQLIVMLFWSMSNHYGITAHVWFNYFIFAGLFSSVVVVISTSRNLKKSSLRPSDNYTPDIDLPTISVCIPARNETEELPACLESIVACDYPKLEILVLDDCSQDKTSEIIKGFAQKGVRFIAGNPPKNGWLAKNQAYQALSEAASGDILVFCGVDVRFKKTFLKTLVATMRARNKQMISIMPRGAQKNPNAGVIQPARYWWELALPRRLFNRPPVLSTFWAIENKQFKKLGGMEAVSSMIVPEAYFAKQLTENDDYSFMRSTGKLHIESTKTFEEQWNTSVRVRYPQLRKRPESVAIVLFLELSIVITPVWLFYIGFLQPFGIMWQLVGIATLLYGWSYFRIISAYRHSHEALMVMLLPVALLTDVIVILYSMYRYEFRSVIWKERDICIPVMQHIPRLPKV